MQLSSWYKEMIRSLSCSLRQGTFILQNESLCSVLLSIISLVNNFSTSCNSRNVIFNLQQGKMGKIKPQKGRNNCQKWILDLGSFVLSVYILEICFETNEHVWLWSFSDPPHEGLKSGLRHLTKSDELGLMPPCSGQVFLHSVNSLNFFFRAYLPIFSLPEGTDCHLFLPFL